jgi:hypothetical protein
MVWVAALAIRIYGVRSLSSDDDAFSSITWILVLVATVIVALIPVRFIVRSARARRWGRVGLGVLGVVLISIPLRLVFFPPDSVQIDDAIDAAFTSADPSYCDSDVTSTYLEQQTDAVPPFADDICERDADYERADAVDVDDMRINGSRATASVTVDGGSFDRFGLGVEIVKDDGDWKVNRIVGFERFDRASFDASYRRKFAEFGSPPSAAGCAIAKARTLTDLEIERIILRSQPGPWAQIAVECDRTGVERSFVSAFERSDYDLPHPVLSCIEHRIEALSDEELTVLADDPVAYGSLPFECDRAATLAGLRKDLAGYEDLGTDGAGCVIRHVDAWPAGRIVRLTYDDSAYDRLIDGCKS